MGKKNKINKVSVIIPTYNRAYIISETLESVLNQTLKKDLYEIIVVDDGSTDNTEEVVNSFKAENLQYFKKEHSGVAATRNYGIKKAKGEFIWLLDSDDVLFPYTLEKATAEFENDTYLDLVYGKLIQTYRDLNKIYRVVDYPTYTREEFVATLIWSTPLPSGCMIRKKCFEVAGLFDTTFKRAVDYEFWSRLGKKQDLKLKYLPIPLYKQRGESEDRLSAKPDRRWEAEIVRRLLKLYSLEELFPQLSNLPSNQRNAIAFLNIGRIFINWEAYNDAISYLKKCLKIVTVPEAYTLLSLCYEKLGNLKEANFYKETAMRFGI